MRPCLQAHRRGRGGARTPFTHVPHGALAGPAQCPRDGAVPLSPKGTLRPRTRGVPAAGPWGGGGGRERQLRQMADKRREKGGAAAAAHGPAALVHISQGHHRRVRETGKRQLGGNCGKLRGNCGKRGKFAGKCGELCASTPRPTPWAWAATPLLKPVICAGPHPHLQGDQPSPHPPARLSCVFGG